MNTLRNTGLWVVQGYYSQGWEDLTASETRQPALVDAKAYRDNASDPIRIVHRWVPRDVVYSVGDRIKLDPGEFGKVVKLGTQYYHVKMDHSGKIRKARPEDILVGGVSP